MFTLSQKFGIAYKEMVGSIQERMPEANTRTAYVRGSYKCLATGSFAKFLQKKNYKNCIEGQGLFRFSCDFASSFRDKKTGAITTKKDLKRAKEKGVRGDL